GCVATCDDPPAPFCRQGKRVTSGAAGQCMNGACQYPEVEMACPMGCANGSCVAAGATFTQVLPRVRHPITAVDQRPGSNGDDVIVAGPAGQASHWNGTQWASVPTGISSDFSAVWYSGVNSAWLVTASGLFHATSAGVSRVTGFPQIPAGAKL